MPNACGAGLDLDANCFDINLSAYMFRQLWQAGKCVNVGKVAVLRLLLIVLAVAPCNAFNCVDSGNTPQM